MPRFIGTRKHRRTEYGKGVHEMRAYERPTLTAVGTFRATGLAPTEGPNGSSV
ncbi:keywimysin-related RiPP [Streptomyces lomondensis]|uniref:Uncharacterized protein n=1 Tax=Streptomyces lomondensis TaxID=68229 RepID=A0ABQ2WW81_9ACTN|nr:hypothetical protein GCM10010383_03090 [Streptomyces lomondensis]